MQEGCIVYLVGGEDIPDTFDLESQCRRWGVPAQRVELVGAHQGFFSVEDAWHFLLTQGCGRVNLLVARWEEDHLIPVHPPLRLHG